MASKNGPAELHDAQAPAWIKWKQRGLMAWAGVNDAAQFRNLPEDEGAYLVRADDNPQKANKEGAMVAGTSALGKEQRREKVADVKVANGREVLQTHSDSLPWDRTYHQGLVSVPQGQRIRGWGLRRILHRP